MFFRRKKGGSIGTMTEMTGTITGGILRTTHDPVPQYRFHMPVGRVRTLKEGLLPAMNRAEVEPRGFPCIKRRATPAASWARPRWNTPRSSIRTVPPARLNACRWTGFWKMCSGKGPLPGLPRRSGDARRGAPAVAEAGARGRRPRPLALIADVYDERTVEFHTWPGPVNPILLVTM